MSKTNITQEEIETQQKLIKDTENKLGIENKKWYEGKITAVTDYTKKDDGNGYKTGTIIEFSIKDHLNHEINPNTGNERETFSKIIFISGYVGKCLQGSKATKDGILKEFNINELSELAPVFNDDGSIKSITGISVQANIKPDETGEGTYTDFKIRKPFVEMDCSTEGEYEVEIVKTSTTDDGSKQFIKFQDPNITTKDVDGNDVHPTNVVVYDMEIQAKKTGHKFQKEQWEKFASDNGLDSNSDYSASPIKATLYVIAQEPVKDDAGVIHTYAPKKTFSKPGSKKIDISKLW